MRRLADSPAIRFVLTLGVVDRFGDVTSSAGASMNDLFLGSLGAGAAPISTAGGSMSPQLPDRRSRRVHRRQDRSALAIILTGYAFNLLAVPALALAGQWPSVAALIVIQGLGRGARKPITDALFSYTTGQQSSAGPATARAS